LPGVVTGKLSDLAGLFALPLLLAALTALALRPRSRRVLDGIGLAAVAVVSLGFALVKASPPIAAAVSSVWSFVLPTRLGADPADLLTLAVAPLAYVAWVRTDAAPRVLTPARRRGSTVALLTRLGRAAMITIAVIVGTAVTTATSCDDRHSIDEVFLGTDGAVYARGSETSRSDDGGHTWQLVESGTVPDRSPDQQVTSFTLAEEERQRLLEAQWEADSATATNPDDTAVPTEEPAARTESLELCSAATCWRSDLGDSTLTEQDLATGRTRTLIPRGESMCTWTQPFAAMTLIRHDGSDVLIASDADFGVVRLEPGERPERIDLGVPDPPSAFEWLRNVALGVAAAAAAATAITLLVASRRRRRSAPTTPPT